MFIVGILTWWYSGGLIERFAKTRERVLSTIDYFSIDLLLKTLFAPFRQISAGKVNGSLDVRWHAFIDRLISRSIGAIVRSITIIVGIVGISITILLGFISVFLWLLVPLLPIAGVVMTIIGWTPWN